MKALITGGGGFVGKYLINELKTNGYDVYATHLENEKTGTDCHKYVLDVTDGERVAELFSEIQPDVIYHLSAQSSVALSWKKPQLTAEVNVIGALNVLEALKNLSKSDTRLLLVGSGEEYGILRENACPIAEGEVLNPANVYAVTKACQGMLGKVYARAYGMNIISVRAFNHTGAGQSEVFVVSDFCRQIAEIEAGIRPPEIVTGNLSAKRDFTDVRDIVRAYRLLGEKGKSGKTYNVGRGSAVEIEEILRTAIRLSKVSGIVSRTDPQRMRAVDIPVIEPDVSEILRDTGWKAEIPLEKTICDTLDYWRKHISINEHLGQN